jgi:septal ring factor EnvC (AmiA/AmiB activator)
MKNMYWLKDGLLRFARNDKTTAIARLQRSRSNPAFYPSIIALVVILLVSVFSIPASAKDSRQEILNLQKKKSELSLQQKRLSDDILNFEITLQNLSVLHSEKEKNLNQSQEQISRKLPLLARFGRTSPLRLLGDASMGNHTLRGIILIRSFTNSIKQQIHHIHAEMNEINALAHELEEKTKTYQQLVQGLEFEQSQLAIIESKKIEDFKKSETSRLANEDDVNNLLDEAQATISKKEGKAKKAAAAKKLPFRWLETPVRGKIVNNKELQKKFNPQGQGVIFETKKKADVIAPSKGVVVFKGPFRKQGDILIIDHGAKIFSVFMGMHKIDAQVGQNVYAGEKLGMMAGYGSSPPKLYFELRQEGKAINPKPYFAK